MPYRFGTRWPFVNGLPAACLIVVAGQGCVSEAPEDRAQPQLGTVEQALSSPKKVEICHKGNTISVDQSAVTAHLKHGDVARPARRHVRRVSAMTTTPVPRTSVSTTVRAITVPSPATMETCVRRTPAIPARAACTKRMTDPPAPTETTVPLRTRAAAADAREAPSPAAARAARAAATATPARRTAASIAPVTTRP